MPEKISFQVSPRVVQGKKVKNLRKEGIVPANIVSESQPSTMISVNRRDFNRLYDKTGDTSVIYLKIGDKTEEIPVLVEEVEINPLDTTVQHVVFRQVNLREKIEAAIPVELVGENKVAGAVVITVHDEIQVRALPTDLPEKFEIDVRTLAEIGQAVTFADLKFDRNKVELVLEEDLDTPVVVLQEVKEEVVEETPTEGTEGVTGESEATSESSNTPAETAGSQE